MPHRSDPRLLVLHGLRLKGVAEGTAVASATGLPPATVAAQLDELARRGLVERREGLLTGWTLTPTGRLEHDKLLADELVATRTRPAVEQGYRGFLRLNPGVLDACSRWQVREVRGRMVRNDHGDRRYDAAVIDDLKAALDRVRPVGDGLAGALERFRPYTPRLAEAVVRVRSGDGDYVAKPVIPSFHTVWFEMHEDLLVTLGLDRSSETAGCEAAEGAW
jgi:DNA-binding MarR family transcriptional regulator